jgi:hypothetical protein
MGLFNIIHSITVTVLVKIVTFREQSLENILSSRILSSVNKVTTNLEFKSLDNQKDTSRSK